MISGPCGENVEVVILKLMVNRTVREERLGSPSLLQVSPETHEALQQYYSSMWDFEGEVTLRGAPVRSNSSLGPYDLLIDDRLFSFTERECLYHEELSVRCRGGTVGFLIEIWDYVQFGSQTKP